MLPPPFPGLNSFCSLCSTFPLQHMTQGWGIHTSSPMATRCCSQEMTLWLSHGGRWDEWPFVGPWWSTTHDQWKRKSQKYPSPPVMHTDTQRDILHNKPSLPGQQLAPIQLSTLKAEEHYVQEGWNAQWNVLYRHPRETHSIKSTFKETC